MNTIKIMKDKNNNTFEDIKHIDENGYEYWYARELMQVLEYKRWDKFNNVIDSAKVACQKSNNLVDDHFSQVGKMVEIGSGPKENKWIMNYQDMLVTSSFKTVILEKKL